MCKFFVKRAASHQLFPNIQEQILPSPASYFALSFQPAAMPSSIAAVPCISRTTWNDSSAAVHAHMEKSYLEQVVFGTAMLLIAIC